MDKESADWDRNSLGGDQYSLRDFLASAHEFLKWTSVFLVASHRLLVEVSEDVRVDVVPEPDHGALIHLF